MAVPEVAERKALVLTIVAMALVCVVLGAGAYFAYKETDKLETENLQLRTSVKDLEGKEKELPQKEKELKEALGKKDAYEDLLPSGKEQIEDLLARLAKVATDTDLEILNTERLQERAVIGGRTPEQKPYKEIAFQFEFGGTFHQFARFISLIENHQDFGRFIAVSNLEITAQDRGLVRDDAKQKHAFELKLTTYRYEAAEQTAAAADPLAKFNKSVVDIYRARGMSDEEIIKQLTGGAAAGAVADTAVGQIFDPFDSKDPQHKPDPEYTQDKGDIRRIDPFTFAAAERRVVFRPPTPPNGENGGKPTNGPTRPKLEQARAEVRQLVAEASTALSTGAYSPAVERCRDAQDIIDGAAGMLDGERPAVEQLLLTAQRLERRRQIENEFARLDLKISMLAWRPRGATAVINGTLVTEGSRIAPAGKGKEAVYVYRILPQGVVFLFRGVKFMQRLNAPGTSAAPTGS